MTTWFRFYDETLNDAKVQRLSGDKFKVWVNLLCIASKHDGMLPPLADLAFALRLGQEKITALLEELAEKGLLSATEVGYAPSRWSERQYKSDVTDATAATRMQRYRDRKRNARNGDDRNDCNGDGPRRINRKIPDESAVTGDGGLVEVTDEEALVAWDEFGKQTTGKGYPRNRRGGWRFPTKWPPGHQAEVRVIGRTA